jgi:hypothetical protein
MPSRVTPNDAKRQAWFADLANTDVPLYKLGKSVPHGAKGGDLLDLLQTNNVAIPRAVWFLRVFGANETVCVSLPIDFSNLNCTILRLACETNLHITPRSIALNGQMWSRAI